MGDRERSARDATPSTDSDSIDGPVDSVGDDSLRTGAGDESARMGSRPAAGPRTSNAGRTAVVEDALTNSIVESIVGRAEVGERGAGRCCRLRSLGGEPGWRRSDGSIGSGDERRGVRLKLGSRAWRLGDRDAWVDLWRSCGLWPRWSRSRRGDE